VENILSLENMFPVDRCGDVVQMAAAQRGVMRRRASDRSVDEEAVWRRNDGSDAAGMSEDHRACLMVGRLLPLLHAHTRSSHAHNLLALQGLMAS
jgi:hypothetical protein